MLNNVSTTKLKLHQGIFIMIVGQNFLAPLFLKQVLFFFYLDNIDHEITVKNLEFIHNSIEKVKAGFLLSSLFMPSELNGAKP